MGVLRHNDQPELLKLEEISYADYIFDEDLDEYIDAQENNDGQENHHPIDNNNNLNNVYHNQQERKKKKCQQQKQRSFGLDWDTNHSSHNGSKIGQNCKKSMGNRKWRRMENARLLNALADPEDICDDLSDMLPKAISAFTKLFIEHVKMKAWNDFIELTEEEQSDFLENEGAHTKNEQSSSEIGYVLGGRRSGFKDKRCEHAAYSAEACFRRLDGRYQALLMERHLPWGLLRQFEQELSDYFSAQPRGVCIKRLEHGVERLFLHTVAQYLSLRSKSTSLPNNKKCRETAVKNPKPFFVPPKQMLVDYLLEKRNKQQKEMG